MSTSLGFVVLSMFALSTIPTSAHKDQLEPELILVNPGDVAQMKCGLTVCDGSLTGDVLTAMLSKLNLATGKMTRLASLESQNLTDNQVYDLVLTDTVGTGIDITVSQEEQATMEIQISEVKSEDAYVCTVFSLVNDQIEGATCVTKLLLTGTSAVPLSTPDTTRGKPDLEGNLKTSAPEKREGSQFISMKVFELVMMVVYILLCSITLILIIKIYLKVKSRDLTQNTSEKNPPADKVEEMVAKEPIYSVVKKC